MEIKQMLQIEKNIKIPANDESKWPFNKMEVGDCVKVHEFALMTKAQGYCHVYATKTNKKFKTKKIDGVMHIWRIK